MYMDDIELFAKKEKELRSLIPTIRIYNLDIGLKFDIDNEKSKKKNNGRNRTDYSKKNQNVWRKGKLFFSFHLITPSKAAERG